MRRKLLPLQLYRMDSESRAEAELSAAAEGLDLVCQALESLTQEAFIETAEKLGLVVWGLVFGSERTDLSPELWHKMLPYHGAVMVNDSIKESVERALFSTELHAELWEVPREQKLHVICYEVLDQQIVRYRLERSALCLLPTHLEIILDFGKATWAYLQETEKTFQQLGEPGYT